MLLQLRVHHCGVDLVQMVPTVVIATIVIELGLFVCFLINFLLSSLVLTDFLGCVAGAQWWRLQPWCWSWRLPGLVVTLPAAWSCLPLLFLNCISQLFFFTVFLICISQLHISTVLPQLYFSTISLDWTLVTIIWRWPGQWRLLQY